MQVSNPNNVKIYNLSAGKSLPEWLSEKKRRKLQKQDVDIRRRIELIQDFAMPHVSNVIKVTKDKQYIIAAGTYKPMIRVYDTNQLALKYEKVLDSHAVQITCLEDDYSKVVILQDDRYIEFHHKYGKIFRTRIPKFGRDMAYHFPSCDLYIAAFGDEVYRLNLEQGKFLNSLKTNSKFFAISTKPMVNVKLPATIECKKQDGDPIATTKIKKFCYKVEKAVDLKSCVA